MLNFAKYFYCIIWEILSFILLIWCIILIDFHMLKQLCITGIFHLVMMYMLYVFLDLVCLVLVAELYWPHRMRLEVFPCSILLKSLWKIGDNSSLFLVKFTKSSRHGFLFVGYFLITNSISLLVKDLFRFSTSSWVSFSSFSPSRHYSI